MSDPYSTEAPEPMPPIDEGALASEAGTAAAVRTARSVIKKTPTGLLPTPKISTPAEYDALMPNTEYLDPEGNLRRKPWQAKDAASYASIPEGESYTDPEGNIRRKPKYESVDFTTQTLHNMAINPKERRRALERAYPGQVKEHSSGELYVEDEEGVLRKPGSGNAWKRVGAGAASIAAPATLSTLGAIGGTAAGPAGTAAGGFGGAVLGQAFNDMILHIAGVADRDVWEEGGNLMKAGAMGAAGAGVGRGIAAVAPVVAGASQVGGQLLPRVAAHILGADPAALKQAIEITEKGYRVSPSAWAKESPYLHKVADAFDPAFRTQRVLEQDAARFMEDEGGKALDTLGVPRNFPQGRESLVNPKSAVSSEEAGAALMAKAKEEMVVADANLARAAAQAKASAAVNADTKSAAFKQGVDELRAAERTSMESAQRAINVGFDHIQADVNAAMKAAEVGASSGDLWTGVAQKLQSTRNAIVKNAKKRYDRWDDTYGALIPDSEGLPQLADQVLAQLPETFQAKYPDIVKRIGDIAGKYDKEAGARVLAEDVEPITLGQLHNLRSLLRSNVNYYDLTPDVRDGVFKLFSGKVNEVIQARGADPLFREAATVLNDIDAYYGKNMKTFKDRTIQSVVNAIEAGVPADPKILADTILKEGRTDLTNKVRKMVGPNYWNAVKASDLQEILDQSRSLTPGLIDGKRFVAQVLDRDRSRMLEAVHGPETAARLRTQAQYVEMAAGKMDIPAGPNDTIVDLIQRAQQAAVAAKVEAAADPIKTLTREMKTIEADFQRQKAAMVKSRRADQLGFLYDPTVGATEAADKILKNHDLILATVNRFGEASPEVNLLRQVYVQRILQGTMEPGKRLEKITPEIQRIMLPGASLDEVQTLAKNMEFLLGPSGGDQAGTSIAAASRVLNPWGQITGLGPVVKPLTKIPGMDMLGRSILTKYYAFVTDLATRPATLQWVAKGLNGSPMDREAIKRAVQSAMAKGGPIGAAVGEGAYQVAPTVDMQPPTREQVMRR